MSARDDEVACAVDECLFEGGFVAAHDGHGDTDAGGGEDEPNEAKERFQPRCFKRRKQKPLQPYSSHFQKSPFSIS